MFFNGIVNHPLCCFLASSEFSRSTIVIWFMRFHLTITSRGFMGFNDVYLPMIKPNYGQ